MTMANPQFPILAEPWQPLWFVLIVPPQGELTATAWLAREGITEAWHPTEMVYVRSRFKPGKRIPKIKPLATGYLFAKLDRRPIWPFLFDQSRGKVQDVLRIGDRPVALADADLMAMKELPERLRAMRQAAIDAKTIRPGDTATISGGLMEGWTITVEAVANGLAYFTAPTGRASVAVERLQK
jgi:hypothetical protein